MSPRRPPPDDPPTRLDDPPTRPSDAATTGIYEPGRKKSETRRGYERSTAASPGAPAAGGDAAPAARGDAAPAAPPGPSQPLRAVSHKTPGFESDKFARPLPEVKLRSMGEVRNQTPARGMGNLAPPRDPKQARTRRVQDYVIWGSAAVIVASIVMLLVWFLAR